MANEEQLRRLKVDGVAAWNKWREANPDEKIDLSGADLGGAALGGAEFGDAYLGGARFIGADLTEANFSGAGLLAADLRVATVIGANLKDAAFTGARFEKADLTAANLDGADLGEANLAETKLAHANLSGAKLLLANLAGADLRGADLTGAAAGFTILADIDLSVVKGLETVNHVGPSSIGIDTIYRSRGKIPEIFLRGCGVPEAFILQMNALVGAIEPIQFYSCFISYSTADREFAERLYIDLQAKNVRCWCAAHDIQAGKKIHEQIDKAIRDYDKLLLILSENSMSSEWVKTEIAMACQRESHENRRMLFPLRLAPFEAIRNWKCPDADTGKDLAREIREFHIPDFSAWKDHDAYKKALDDLLHALKAEAAKGKGTE